MSTNIHQIALVAIAGSIPQHIKDLEEFEDGSPIKCERFNTYFSYDKSVLYVLLKGEKHFGDSYDVVDTPSLIHATNGVRTTLREFGFEIRSDLIYINQIYCNASDNPLDLLTAEDDIFNEYLKPMNIL